MRRLLISFLLLMTAGVARAETDMPWPKAGSPEEVGLSSAQLTRLSAVTRAHVEAQRLPGAVLLVARYGKIAWFEAIGHRDRDANVAMTHDSIFRIYSMTKPITSVATMMLLEEGKLQISDPVGRHIPELANLKLGVEKPDGNGKMKLELAEPPRQPTVQDLLRHTSGFTYGTRGDSLVKAQYREKQIGNRDRSNAELVAQLGTIPLMYAPGSRWEYGVSTDVLGRLVEVVSGRTLGEFFQTRIFQKLGMRDTAFSIGPDKMARAAQPAQTPGGPPMTPRFDVAKKAAYESGGGGLVGTALDYLRFCAMLMDGGEFNGQRLLGKKTVEFMTADHLGTIPYDEPGLGFGLGFQVRKTTGIARLAGSVGEYGWAGNAGTIFWIDPAEQLVAIYMIQVSDGERVALRNQFRSMVQAAIIE